MTASEKRSLGTNRLDTWLLTFLGPLAMELKSRWIFALGTLFTVISGILVPYLAGRNDEGEYSIRVKIILICCAILGALFVLGDKLADRYERRTSESQELELKEKIRIIQRSAEQSAQDSVTEINWLLEHALRLPFLRGSAKSNQLDVVRMNLVKAVAGAVGPGSRATYYTLSGATKGSRKLIDPLHAVTRGRGDRPFRPWIESDTPDHEIWTILDRSDNEPQIRRDGDEASGLNWEKAPYNCFVSVPVKARGAAFGLLSVNSADQGAIGETQRLLVITAARLLALVESFHLGPEKAMKMLDLSDPFVTIQLEGGQEDETSERTSEPAPTQLVAETAESRIQSSTQGEQIG